ncbi:DUF4910 domain-containing protein [Streptacidiphilus sp. PB12-B1b]|uniref:DUF4910 domain-containing protein n=1 Tax=Streptacidiphilus sp. PB12-B1b TaxID=2705012 RepID=UPI0015FDA399|nr:DUF4910 domain-containing protein [Streptacidiphilus sp. PB12-B1b]QMU77874.1 DUF4910 domain-containing protein [Streptacidiphilus sp. PB12-B1b]
MPASPPTGLTADPPHGKPPSRKPISGQPPFGEPPTGPPSGGLADLGALVGRVHREIDAEEAMRRVARLVAWDRYQGSAGIAAAADYVAGEAERVGLTGVEVLSFPADGRTAWWTFTSPAPWTPRAARLWVAGRPPLVRYPEQPYALAAGSAAADGEAPLALPQEPGWKPGAVVLLGSAAELGPELFARMRQERAAGFCVVTHPDRDDQVGRVELPPGTGLFGFSVRPGQLAGLRAAHRRGEPVRVLVELDPGPGRMPVVVARTPSGDGPGCLLAAHLCHPAPSANDNASGVAAALAAGQVLAGRELRRPVRFVWGPEFTGLAAWTHRAVEQGAWPLPMMAVNLDMVGEDQRRCGGPLIVEHGPEYLPHFAGALVEACVRALPPAARSYSGAVDCDVWAWRATPFVGASDHAVLADRAIGCPSVQLGHWPDRFNHSSADTLDKVDPQELRRAAAVAASAALVAAQADGAAAGGIADLLVRWTAERMTACLPPTADRHAAARLTRRWQYGRDALRTLAPLGADAAQLDARAARLDDLHRALSAAWPDRPHTGADAEAHAGADAGPALCRAWPGPFNLRALLGAVAPEDRNWLLRESAADRGRFYACAMALAQSVDGSADAAAVVRAAELDSGLDQAPGFGPRFLAAMVRAGWLHETDER